MEKKQEKEAKEWEEERRRKVEEREEVEKAATARLEQEVERLSKEGQERLAIEVERHTAEEERERQRFEEEKRLRREETDKALERLKEEQEVQTLRVKEEEEKVRRGLEGKVSELEGKLRCLEEAAGQGRDYRLATAHGKLTMLQQEIDSLKTVVEMRTTELHQLRAEKVRVEFEGDEGGLGCWIGRTVCFDHPDPETLRQQRSWV